MPRAHAIIEFTSDDSDSYQGFKLDWKVIGIDYFLRFCCLTSMDNFLHINTEMHVSNSSSLGFPVKHFDMLIVRIT